MRRKQLAGIIAAVVMAVGLTACGGGSTTETTEQNGEIVGTEEAVAVEEVTQEAAQTTSGGTAISGDDFKKVGESFGYTVKEAEAEDDADYQTEYDVMDLDDIDFYVTLQVYETEEAAGTAMTKWTRDSATDNVDYEFETNDNKTAALLKDDNNIGEFLWVGNTIFEVEIANSEDSIKKANEFIDAVGGDYAAINILK